MNNHGDAFVRSSTVGNRTRLILWVLATALFNSIFDASAAELCAPAIALVVSVQGIVEVRRFKEKNWQPALLNANLCPGDAVRVRQRSRAALRLSNESMLRLDQKTTLVLPGPDADNKTVLEMITGAIHVLTRTPKPFRINTPFLNAGVEGTEFLIQLDQDQARLVMYEGKLSASNEHGSIVLAGSEEAVAARNQAPRKGTAVRPLDAVQWALFYPPILHFRPDEQVVSESATRSLRAATDLYEQGRVTEALEALDSMPADEHSARLFIYRAGLLLSVGRIDEANGNIAQALRIEPGNSDAYALQAVIATVQNDKERALALAHHAVDLNATSSSTRLALSYAQQAHFRVEEALESAKKAVELDRDNALAWARLAELQMSAGYLDRAIEAAQRAVELQPDLPRTQTVLGFAYLVQIDTGAARTAFSRAVEFDQSDPMPRLGIGLAKIREGHLEAGRIDIEIAASLDPANSLIRSYLGKAYFEERRYSLAGTQFDLAKERDPNDPTPWLYDGIMKQTQNQPVQALRDIQKSIELNDNRAVYRSKLLLDQDQAARGSSLARVYDNLGFGNRAIVETAKSLTIDPANHSAHRFLSDTYADTPRYEVARVSELLQAQLLQPVNVNPVQPRLAVADLNIITGTGPARAGFNEFTPLLERNKPQLVASGLIGNQSTRGDEIVLSALYNRASMSVGQFHHNTEGFRPNNDQKHNVYNVFLQYAATPRFNIQAEVRTRKTEHGDLLLDFDPALFTPDRRKLGEDTARIGARYMLSPNQDLILSGIYTDRKEDLIAVPDNMFPGTTVTDTITTKSKGYQAEAQYLLRSKQFNVTAGGGAYQIDASKVERLDFGIPCPPFMACTLGQQNFKRERYNGYVYTNINLPRDITGTIGGSYVSLKEGTNLDIDKFNPKFGLQWDITRRLRLRLAWFETVKSALIANPTLEPTQVAGFNQLFDDVNGTTARRRGAGLDAHVLENLYAGVEVSDRKLGVPFFEDNLAYSRTESQQENLYRAYLYLLPHPYFSARGEFQFEKFARDASANGPYGIETASAPVNISFFHPSGVFAKLTTTFVQQKVKSQTPENSGVDDFTLLDAAVGYRLPNRRGIVSLEGRNLMDEHFFYRNVNFQASEPVYYQRFTPHRTLFLRVTLNF
jgi:tetratricopeptide (TPR) repeat protein